MYKVGESVSAKLVCLLFTKVHFQLVIWDRVVIGLRV